MKAIAIARQAPVVSPNVALVDWPDPAPPAAGCVLIRTIASALNHMDLWVGRGIPGVNLTYPRVSGCDACGIVVDAGPGVDRVWLGRRVIVNAALEKPPRNHPDDPPASTLAPDYELIGEHHSPGMHAELFVAPVANIADVGTEPESGLDAADAAAFGLTFLTAWSMIVTKGQLRPGQSVLITGIGGGVATAALAIARHFACPTIVTSRHAWKLERAAQLGATRGILDTAQDWSRDVRTLTNKRGVDIAVDSVGKSAHLPCIKSLTRGGAYLTPGCTSGPDATTDLARLFWNQLRLLGSTMGSNDEFRQIVSLLRHDTLKPVIDRVFEPGQCHEAWHRLEAGDQFGKVVIRWA